MRDRRRNSAVAVRVRPTRWLLTVLMLALAGCATESSDLLPPEHFASAPPAEDAEKPDPAAEKPSPPRTLPQAVHAYLHCLLSPKPSAEEGAKDAKPEKADEKSNNGKAGNGNPGNGQAPKNDRSPPEQKSPQAGGEQKGGNGQDNDKKEENGKEKAERDKEKPPEPAWYSAHAQSTVVIQAHPSFRSPYVGPNSLVPDEPSATSMTGTLFLDTRLWECGSYSGELVFNPEIAGGRGLSGVVGIAGFPNGEITRVSAVEPTPYIARLFLRQTWGMGGEQEQAEDAPNLIAGKRDVDRFTLSVGKFSATDFADDNRYSHDPRTQFLPWSVMYNGAWDYPANVRGYTYGVAAELNRKDWALRYGIFAEPAVANGAELDPRFTKAFGQVLEWERRYTFRDHPGHLRLLAYLNRAHMGDYSEALAAMPVNPDVTLTRDYRFKYGFGLSWDQELNKDLGVFGRLGWSDGHTESWAFTAIDRVAVLGLLLKGRCWCRPNDFVGIAIDANGLAQPHRQYLTAGGLDFIIGDGRLNYEPEEILEIFYIVEVRKGIYVTADFQEVNNPAYNRDRGPVVIGALRAHIEF